jgi:hypothetical protein
MGASELERVGEDVESWCSTVVVVVVVVVIATQH